MSEQEVAVYRARRDITVEGHVVPRPIRLFHEAGFPVMQCQGWPMALKGRVYLIGIAETGSGKTLAKLLPALLHFSAPPRLEMGAVEMLIVWENLDITRFELKNISTGELSTKHFNKDQEAYQKNFWDSATGADLEI